MEEFFKSGKERMPMEAVLFEGELGFAVDGIYTYAHSYEHSESNRKVLIVGMNHAGDQEYFDSVNKMLSDQEVVLYEGLLPEEDSGGDTKRAAKDLENLEGESLDTAFHAAISAYFRSAQRYLQLVGEESAFDYSSMGWESGDAEFLRTLKTHEKTEHETMVMQTDLSKLTLDCKNAVVEFTKKSLQKMQDGEFNKKDLREGLLFFWSDPVMVNIFQDAWSRSRDEAVMGRFDYVVKEKNPSTIAIKFGAAHIANLRKMLEDRGYLLQQSVELKNIAF